MPRITIYSKENCMQCTMTKKQLKEKGIEFLEKRIDLVPEYIDEVKETGFSTVPVIIDNLTKDLWNGFRPDKLSNLNK